MLRRVPILVVLLCAFAPAQTAPSTQTTQPTQTTTQPGRQSAEEMLAQMLRPTTQAAAPLKPVADGGGGVVDHSSGANAVAPGTPQLPLTPEGTIITDRVGRIARTDDGKNWELTLDADGPVMQDPPMLVLPNRTLTNMVNASLGSSADLRFRISGEVTEFDNRNYILIQKASQVPTLTQPLR